MSSPAGPSFATLARQFRKYHQNSVNVALHVLTTPLGIVGFLRLLLVRFDSVAVPCAVCAVYLVCLFRELPRAIFWRTAVGVAAICGIAVQIVGWRLGGCIGALITGFVGQDFSHLITGEQTFQSSYMSNASWFTQLLEHTYYLLPLVIDSALECEYTPLSFFVAQNRLIETRLRDKRELESLKRIESFVISQRPSQATTSHFWFSKLPPDLMREFRRVAESPSIREAFARSYGATGYAFDIVDDMNEIYVASSNAGVSSDGVFYMKHIDGPFGLWPFCSVYRGIIAVNFNQEIETCFTQVPSKSVLSNGDVSIFDFNREVHYIRNTGTPNPAPGFRICLKIHYSVYPKALCWLGWACTMANTAYNLAARGLFRKTIYPRTITGRFGALFVLANTYIAERVETLAGWNNIVYVALLWVAQLCLPLEAWFGGGPTAQYVANNFAFLATSFHHYFIYFGTFYQRVGVAYYRFQRDAEFYKVISIGQLALKYVLVTSRDGIDWTSMALIVGGYSVAGAAAVALGIDTTYFGIELGISKPIRVTSFPYNVIPHPMIVGACVALSGFHKLEGLREEHPYVAPTHIMLYLLHMTQEIFDIHAGGAGVARGRVSN